MYMRICTILILALSYTHNVHGVVKRSPSDAIKYPGPIKEVTNRHGVTEDVPESCKDQNFCTIKPVDYPQESFNSMFKGAKPIVQPKLVLPSDIDNRQGDPEDVDNCESKITYEPLYKVRDKRDKTWRTVVQAPQENYVQLVRLETCKNPEGSCFTAFPSMPDLKTFCKQKYNDWEILVSDDKGGTKKIMAELPVCCSCHYKSIDLPNRFGDPKN